MSETNRQITITVPAKVYDRVMAMGNAAGMSTSAYAAMLFMAAYSARCAPTGDRDLDAAVSRVVAVTAKPPKRSPPSPVVEARRALKSAVAAMTPAQRADYRTLCGADFKAAEAIEKVTGRRFQA